MYMSVCQHIKSLIKVEQSINEICSEVPAIQRQADNDTIDAIYQFQNVYYKTNGDYFRSGVITKIITPENKEYLIDGQHRVIAFKKLCKDYPDRPLKLMVDLIYLDSGDEKLIEDVYRLINTNRPNEISRLPTDKYRILQGVEKFFRQNFSEYLKTTENPHRPCLNIDKLKTYIINNQVLEKLNIESDTEFIQMIRDINLYYSNLVDEKRFDLFRKWGVKDLEGIVGDKISRMSSKMYLGIYTDFEWIDRIVHRRISGDDYSKMNHITKRYRPKITPKLRENVWNCKSTSQSCYCCGDEITVQNFECGHVIPVSLGGSTNLTNLRPICRQCNSSMGCQNLEEYKTLLQEQMDVI